MGTINMFNTMMATAHDLILDTVFFIMGVAVLAGAVGALFSEFGVVALINKGLKRFMGPLFGMPGAASLGMRTTYLSDNPAIISLTKDEGFVRYFKKYQLPLLTNMGTAFGMGLVVTTFMIGQSVGSESFVLAALIGNIGAIIGSVVSVRIMMIFTKRKYGTEEYVEVASGEAEFDIMEYREIRDGSGMERVMAALLDGGKSGVEVGLAIIPGVVIICTIVMMLTNGPSEAGIYTGAAYEGIALLPAIGEKLSFIIEPLFGFSSPEAIAFPITALGAVGAALGLIPGLISEGLIGANDIAVFTAMGMCWSGYLSTHIAMMDGLKCRELAGKSILAHTIGGLAAGISANLIFTLIG